MDGEAPEQTAQKGGGCPMHADTQGQGGGVLSTWWNFTCPCSLEESWTRRSLAVPSNFRNSLILQNSNKVRRQMASILQFHSHDLNWVEGGSLAVMGRTRVLLHMEWSLQHCTNACLRSNVVLRFGWWLVLVSRGWWGMLGRELLHSSLSHVLADTKSSRLLVLKTRLPLYHCLQTGCSCGRQHHPSTGQAVSTATFQHTLQLSWLVQWLRGSPGHKSRGVSALCTLQQWSFSWDQALPLVNTENKMFLNFFLTPFLVFSLPKLNLMCNKRNQSANSESLLISPASPSRVQNATYFSNLCLIDF